MPQHDIYHQYTVDLHTMAVLENMDAFARQDESNENKMLNTIFSRLDRPEVLFLAGLFHDIAKGRGPGHEARGEQIARPVLQRLGVEEESIHEVCWLIRNHLAMTHLAFKKDLHDEALINRFAENVMSRRKLDLLTLLTHADLMAVGPTAINSWRKMLLEELYYRTVDVIEDGGPAGEDLLEWIREIKIVVREKVQPAFRDSYLEDYLASAPSRYFLDFYPGVISEHYNDLRIFMDKEQRTALELQDVIARKIDHKRPGYSSITLIVKDRQGLFYRIAGTLSANRINILSAWSHSIGDIAVATLHVNDIPEGPLDDPERWEHFKSDFSKVMAGSLDIDELVAKRRMKRPYSGTFKPRFPVKVEIDNAASDQATIIEVYAHDRPGLLYDITRKLFDIGLNIVLTKITTEVDQALDVFYVKDADFEKIVDFEILDDVKSALQNHLATMENEHFSKIEGVISF